MIALPSRLNSASASGPLSFLRRYSAAVDRLRAEERRLRSKMAIQVQRGRFRAVANIAKRLLAIQRDLRMLESLSRGSSPRTVHIVLSSGMLARSFQVCTELRAEGLHFITGIEYDGLRIGTEIATLPYVDRSFASASADHQASQDLNAETHESGHTLVALLHSHPGSGIDANHPSSVDLKTQRLWEIGSRLVGGIWTRDGFLRWYAVNIAFTIDIVGHHLERIDAHLFKLVPLEP